MPADAPPPPAHTPAPPPTPVSTAAPAGRIPGWRAVWARAEGQLLAVGLLMTLAAVVAVGFGLLLAPASTLLFATVLGLNMVVGPPAGISFGYASGLGHLEVVLCTLYAETAQMLVLYPLFALSWNHLVDARGFAPMLARLRRAAEAGEQRVQRFGAVGVFMFVFIPLWMTGPVIGAVIGFLIGLRPAVNVAIVLTATVLSLVVYAGFIDRIDAWTALAHPYALFGVIVGVGVLAWLVRRCLRRVGLSGGRP